MSATVVPIRVRMPADQRGRVSFAVSPLLELAMSLHVLADPSHHALHHPWVRRMRRAPAGLRREIAACAPVFADRVPPFVLPPTGAPCASFAEELERVRPGLPQAEDPDRLAALFERYWEEEFARVWARVAPTLEAAAGRGAETVSRRGLDGFLDGLAPIVRRRPGAAEYRIPSPDRPDLQLSFTDDAWLQLAPSAFVWPHALAAAGDPRPFALVYPAEPSARARPPQPPPDLMAAMRALSDDTRVAVLRLVAQQPRSTQEMARLIGITEGGLSKHLRQLAQAGLVTARREGYYVLYRLETDRLEAVSRDLAAYVTAK